MASISDGYKFIYDGISSDELGVILCYFDTSSSSNSAEKSEIVMTTTQFKKTWDYHYKKKSEPLQFPITIAKPNGEYFDANEERKIKKLLCKDKMGWLQVDQPDLSNTYYYCMIYDPYPENVGKRSAGINLSVMNNSQNAWSELKSKTYQTVSNALSFGLYMDIDFDKYQVFPQITITPLSNANITITNSTTSETVTFTNGVTTEVIYLDCSNDKAKSSSGNVILDRWNKNCISLVDGINNFILTGNFKMQLDYRLPIRVGGT